MSRSLVIVQFTMAGVIVLTGAVPVTLFAAAFTICGGSLGIWAIMVMRWDNLRIFPEPKKDIRFVNSGPYRLIRHPMYTALLLASSGFLFRAASVIP